MPLLCDLAMSQYVVTVEDPRMDRTKAHALRDSSIIAMGAGICGADGSNEITAIPLLLDLLDLHGRTVTIDAIGGQTAIADQIVQRGGSYVLALKANQPTMVADVQARFADARVAQQPDYGMTSATLTTAGHGRIETRTAFVIPDPDAIAYLNADNRWRDLSRVALVEDTAAMQVRAIFQQQYGTFSYAHLPKTTYAQTFAQMYRYDQGDYVRLLQKQGVRIWGVEFFYRIGSYLNTVGTQALGADTVTRWC